MRCLSLFDGKAAGAEHTQSRRFCDPDWSGIPSGPKEPPLRYLLEKLASAKITLHDLVTEDSEPVKLFFYWVSSFRLVRVSTLPSFCQVWLIGRGLVNAIVSLAGALIPVKSVCAEGPHCRTLCGRPAQPDTPYQGASAGGFYGVLVLRGEIQTPPNACSHKS